ncbi:MAG: tail fiber domain-containing protein [Bacteroidota bacterium]
MKKICFILFVAFGASNAVVSQGRVGINTNLPQAMLHVKDSSVLFSGGGLDVPPNAGNPPASGTGIRMMWYVDKAAFRAGKVVFSKWDKDNVGLYSFGAGSDVTASGIGSTAFGLGNIASGNGSFATGVGTKATGYASTALGEGTVASGDADATAMGFTTVASGEISTALGYGSKASGFVATSMGNFTTASGSMSTTMGFRTTASSFGSLAIGRYNDSITSSNKTLWVDTDPVFIIGNGTALNDRHNAFTVLKNARTGINTATPEYGLHVVNDNAQDGGHIEGIMIESITTSTNVGEAAVSFKNQSFLSPNKKWITGLNQASNFRWDYDAAFVGGAAMVLDTTGDLTIQGNLTQSSDERLKEHIRPIQNALEKIQLLNGYQYNWKPELQKDKKEQIGLLAQNVEAILPQLVTTDAEGMKSVAYQNLVPVLIEAIKELKKEIEDLKANRK